MDIEELVLEVEKLKARNLKVEADKAWERSVVRISTIMTITYAIVVLILLAIHAQNAWLGAFVPVVGYFLSTQSIPLLKRWWVRRHLTM